FGCPANETNTTSANYGCNYQFGWDRNAIIYVDRSPILWLFQTSVAVICLAEALLLAYLSYKGNVLQTLLSFHFILEIVNNAPFVATVRYHRIFIHIKLDANSGNT
ncbi:unnamed protein product, partial [Medioppia subpectinata]